MKAFLPLLASGLALGCSFPYGDLPRVDAPVPDVPVVGCNALDESACMPGHCAANVSTSGEVDATCYPPGSSNAGGYCADRSFCSFGLACWRDRSGGDMHVCWEICWTSADCRPGYHCDSSTTLTASYLGRAAYPCLPDAP